MGWMIEIRYWTGRCSDRGFGGLPAGAAYSGDFVRSVAPTVAEAADFVAGPIGAGAAGPGNPGPAGSGCSRSTAARREVPVPAHHPLSIDRDLWGFEQCP